MVQLAAHPRFLYAEGMTPVKIEDMDLEELRHRLQACADTARDGLDDGPPHDHQIAPRDALSKIRNIALGGGYWS